MADHSATAAVGASWAAETEGAAPRRACERCAASGPSIQPPRDAWRQSIMRLSTRRCRRASASTRPDDVLRGALVDDEAAMFESLLTSAREHQGPIVVFGAMLGETVTTAPAWPRRRISR